ncbi:hypothetical protein Tco_0264517 [Tanacetum coccineum]
MAGKRLCIAITGYNDVRNYNDKATYSASAEDIAVPVLFLVDIMSLTSLSPRNCILRSAFTCIKASGHIGIKSLCAAWATKIRTASKRATGANVLPEHKPLESRRALLRFYKSDPSSFLFFHKPTLALYSFLPKWHAALHLPSSQNDNGRLEAKAMFEQPQQEYGSVFQQRVMLHVFEVWKFDVKTFFLEIGMSVLFTRIRASVRQTEINLSPEDASESL